MEEKKNNFIVSQEDWSLHRKGNLDQQRHMEKVNDAIKQNLPDLISDESIILSNNEKVIKIPIRSLDEYKIRYNPNKSQHVGQGKGDSKVGDIVARDGSEGHGAGKGGEPGDQPGEDYYEAEVSLDDIETAFFQELALPNLVEKERDQMITERIEFNDVRKKGLMGNIDKKRTILTALLRNAQKGRPTISPIHDEDLRFKTWNEIERHESSAVVLAMMDTSGSMGDYKKYMARSFFFWMTRFLRTKYKHVEIVFIAHHTKAKVVSEEEFYSKGESGGTICSSAYIKALELISDHYNPSQYNIYPIHFSDGENIPSDNNICVELVHEIMSVSNMFGYGEVNAFSRYSTLTNAYQKINNPKFRHYILKENTDVYHTMKHFFKKEEGSYA